MMKLKKKVHRLVAGIAAVVVTAAAVTVSVPTLTTNADSDLGLDNYAKLLQYSLYFYDANMCGDDVGESSAFSWRDDCHTGNVVSGGFHDAGDHIQCGLTTGFTASTMGWMYYEYGEQFDKTGTTQHYRVLMDRFCKLFKDSTTLSSDGEVTSLVYEMGDDGKDHGQWMPPEQMDSFGNDETYSTASGASNVAAQYAAALAQNYINFGNEEDLKYATALYNFATKYRKVTYEQSTYSEQFENCQDDISWAAGWMYLATQEDGYLQENAKYTSCSSNWTDDYFYGNVKLGAAIINAEITGNWSYITNYIDQKVNANQNQYYVMNSWGSARHNTLMQICAMVTTKYQEQSGKDYSEWCKKQMNMILGDNNANVCLVVGYNERSATSPHHRAASNLKSGSFDGWSAFNNWNGDYASSGGHVLYGALCGGPGNTDFTTYQHSAKDATSNEVALDYQVGLVGAAAGLYAYYNTGSVVAEIGDEVTVYPDEVAVANGGTITTTTTETTTTTTTTTTETTTTEETTTTTETTTTETTTTTPEPTTTTETETTITTSESTTTETETTTTEVSTTTETETTVSTETTISPTIIYGDVNTDGVVDLRDSIVLNKYLANIQELTDQQKLSSNCYMADATPNIDDKDVDALVQFVILKIKVLPVTVAE